MTQQLRFGAAVGALLLGLAAPPAWAGGGGGATSEAGEAPSSSGARDSGASTGAAESGPAVTGDNDRPCPQGQRWDNAAAACTAAEGPSTPPQGQ